MVVADIPGKDCMYYLVDEQLNFIAEVKEFLDWKMATNRAPATIKAYCLRLSWYYRFLAQKNLDIVQATPADLTEFVIWLCHPYRDGETIALISQQSPLTATSVNLILQAVGALDHFLVRRGRLTESPVIYIDVPRGKWLKEGDLLAHTRRGQATVQRMELKLKEPKRLPPTVSDVPQDQVKRDLSSLYTHIGNGLRVTIHFRQSINVLKMVGKNCLPGFNTASSFTIGEEDSFCRLFAETDQLT